MKKPARRKKKTAVAKKKVHYIPAGYHSVTPYLACRDAARAIEFYVRAFGAVEVMRMPGPAGSIGHAELRIGDSRVMLADEYLDIDFLSPPARGGTAVHLHLYVKDADAMVQRALAAGARLVREVKDQFYGDRSGTIADPFGHVWHLATHKEDLSRAELRKRAERAMQEKSS
jgi:PhnB protein